MQTLIVTSPAYGQYEYSTENDADAKSVRDTLKALGVSVRRKEDGDGESV